MLTGLVGAGKTSVAVALGELLEERGESYAVVDLDWLGWFRPPAGSSAAPAELIAENLRAVATNFARAGIEWLVLARHVQSAEELEALREAAGMPLTSVRLEVPRAVLEQRLRRRDTGAELAEHLGLIAAAAAAEPFEDAVIGGELGPPREVAREILRVLAG